MRYWSGRYGVVAHTENNTHCSAVRKSDRTDALRSASCSLSPANARSRCSYHAFVNNKFVVKSPGKFKQKLKQTNQSATKSAITVFTFSPWFALVSVHDETIPGSTEHATELRDSKSIGVTTHCGNTRAQRG